MCQIDIDFESKFLIQHVLEEGKRVNVLNKMLGTELAPQRSFCLRGGEPYCSFHRHLVFDTTQNGTRVELRDSCVTVA